MFFTGKPGVGKSSLVRRLLQRLGASVALNGFTTFEIRNSSDSKRAGFQSVDVGDPLHTARLATRQPPGEGTQPRVGPYAVHVPETIAFVQRALGKRKHAERARRLTVLDEVGKMQALCGPGFDALINDAIGPSSHDSVPVLGTLPLSGLHDLALADCLRSREDVVVWEVKVA